MLLEEFFLKKIHHLITDYLRSIVLSLQLYFL